MVGGKLAGARFYPPYKLARSDLLPYLPKEFLANPTTFRKPATCQLLPLIGNVSRVLQAQHLSVH